MILFVSPMDITTFLCFSGANSTKSNPMTFYKFTPENKLIVLYKILKIACYP